MNLRMLSFRSLVRMQAQAVQGSTGRVWSVSVGSVLRALFEANASVALWLQWLVLLVLRQTRAATSSGRDLDTWGADFGFARLPATAAAGQVTFSRAAAGRAAVIPPGTPVRTADGAQVMLVQVDTAHPAWTGAEYTLSPSALAVTVPVLASAPGAAGNIQAGALGLMMTALPGVDTVANAAPFEGGRDAEPDDDMRARFVLFVDSRSRATVGAVGYAIRSLQQGLAYAVAEGVTPDGAPRPGFFTVTVDDGTGTPPTALLDQVFAAVDAVRPVGTAFAVLPPEVVPVAVSLVLTPLPGFRKADLIGPVAQAVLGYVNSLTIGEALSYGRLYQVAFNAAPGVLNVQSLLLNGGQADVGGGRFQVVRSAVQNVAVA